MVAITGQVPHAADRHRRVPGSRHHRHHAADHQAQRARDRAPSGSRPRSPRRSTSPPPAAPARCWSTCPRTSCRPMGVVPGRRRWTCPATGCRARPSRRRPSAQAAALLRQARRPVLYVGGGVIKSDSHAELLRALAELAQAPVTTTLMARGAFPDAHPLALGMPGMHGMLRGRRRAAGGRPARRARRPVRRPGDRQAGRVRAARQDRARRHRPGRDRQEPRSPTWPSSATCAARWPSWPSALAARDRRGRPAGHRGLASPPPTAGSEQFPLRYTQEPAARSSRSTWSSGCPR